MEKKTLELEYVGEAEGKGQFFWAKDLPELVVACREDSEGEHRHPYLLSEAASRPEDVLDFLIMDDPSIADPSLPERRVKLDDVAHWIYLEARDRVRERSIKRGLKEVEELEAAGWGPDFPL